VRSRLLLVFCIKAVVIAFDTLALHFKKRLKLRIFDDFSHAMIHRPDRPADAAFGNAFLETVRVQIGVDLFMVLANGTFHDDSPLAGNGRMRIFMESMTAIFIFASQKGRDA
jgi:hypothetical protein